MLALIETHRSILIAIKSASSNEIEIRVEVSPRWKEDKDNVNLKIENLNFTKDIKELVKREVEIIPSNLNLSI